MLIYIIFLHFTYHAWISYIIIFDLIKFFSDLYLFKFLDILVLSFFLRILCLCIFCLIDFFKFNVFMRIVIYKMLNI